MFIKVAKNKLIRYLKMIDQIKKRFKDIIISTVPMYIFVLSLVIIFARVIEWGIDTANANNIIIENSIKIEKVILKDQREFHIENEEYMNIQENFKKCFIDQVKEVTGRGYNFEPPELTNSFLDVTSMNLIRLCLIEFNKQDVEFKYNDIFEDRIDFLKLNYNQKYSYLKVE